MTTPNVIVLKSPYGRRDEGRAAAAITPGHIVTLDSNLKLVKNGISAGADIEFTVAEEDRLQGSTIDDAYAENDLVKVRHLLPGDEAYCWLVVGQSVTKGTSLLKFDATGCLMAHGGTGKVKARALETVDAGSETKRIKVRII